VNTYFLLVSGVTFTWSHSALLVGNRPTVIKGLCWTLLLAGLFLRLQCLEYAYSDPAINDSVFGSIFFLLTGFHGAHVFLGAVFIFTCLCRVVFPDNASFTRQQHLAFTAALWYWHFVDVVWLFVYILVYFWGSLGAWAPLEELLPRPLFGPEAMVFDAPVPYQLSFQDPATPGMEGIVDLHHEVMFFVLIIIIFILWMLFRVAVLFCRRRASLPYFEAREDFGLEWA
jgi:hypothetical protein